MQNKLKLRNSAKHRAYKERRLEMARHLRLLEHRLKYETREDYVDYYKKAIDYCKRGIAHINHQISKLDGRVEFTQIALVSLIISLILGIGLILFQPQITGLAVKTEQGYFEDLNIVASENYAQRWEPTYYGELTSVRASGRIVGEGSARIYLEDKLLVDSSTLNSTLQTGSEELPTDELNQTTMYFNLECRDTCTISENATDYNLAFEVSEVTVYLDNVTYTINPLEASVAKEELPAFGAAGKGKEGPIFGVAQANWLYAELQYRMNITVNSSLITEPLNNFTVLVKLNSTNFNFSRALQDGADIRFANISQSGNLSYEIERWNSTAQLAEIWVKIPQISNGTESGIQLFWMYYGNSTAISDGQDVKNTWDDYYKLVMHFKEASGSGDYIKDSTKYANNGTPSGTTFQPESFIGPARSYSGTNQWVLVKDSSSLDAGYTGLTIETWVNDTMGDASARGIISKRISSAGSVSYSTFKYTTQYLDFDIGGTTDRDASTQAIPTQKWLYLTVTWNGSDTTAGKRFYFNATNINNAATSVSSLTDQPGNLTIGILNAAYGVGWSGSIDEVRISNITRSAAWLKASYYSEYNQLLKFSAEERSGLIVTISSPLNTTYSQTNLSLNVSANEAIQAWWYNLNNAATNQSFTPNTTITAQSGSNYIIVWANMSTGEVSSAEKYFSVDLTPPIITINSPKGTIADVTPRINVSFDATVSSAWYNIDNDGNITLCTSCSASTSSFLYYNESSHTITVFANDSIGRVNSTNASFTIDMNQNYYDTYDDNSSISTKTGGVRWQAGSERFENVGWWNSSYLYKRQMNISNSNGETARKGYSINLTLDTQSLVDAGELRVDCNDLRVVWWNSTNFLELDRLNESACNSSATEIWFKLQQNISVSQSDSNYHLYYGNSNPGTPFTNKSNIWYYWEDFEDQSHEFTTGTGTLSLNIVSAAAKNGNYGANGTGAGAYSTALKPENLTRGYIAEVWARPLTSPTSSLGALQLASGTDCSYGTYRCGYTIALDQRNGAGSTAAMQIRQDFDYGILLGSSAEHTVSANNWYYVQTMWKADGNLTVTYLNESRAYWGSISAIDNNHTTGYYGLSAYDYMQWDDFKIRLYNSNEPTVNLADEETVSTATGNFTSKAINVSSPITSITNITWAESGTTQNNNISVELSVDNGLNWYLANKSSGLSGFNANSSLVYRVLFAADSTATISLLDMNISWQEGAGNQAPQIADIENIPSQTVTESGISWVTFNVTAYDANGASDLNDTSINATFARTGEALRINTSCAWLQDFGTNYANYSCRIGLMYWDGPGVWNVSAAIRDLSGTGSAYYNESFDLQDFTAITVSLNAISWAEVMPGQQNSLALNSILVNNTGNHNVTLNGVKVTAINLLGANPAYWIPAANFSAATTNACDVGTVLANGTAINVAGSMLPRGNNSAGQGLEDLYFCLEQVPSNIISQQYSTQKAGSWIISVV
jgi:hypothetical protein